MSLSKIEIDYTSGNFSFISDKGKETFSELIERVSSSISQSKGISLNPASLISLNFQNVQFGNVDVKVIIEFSNQICRISIRPPEDISFDNVGSYAIKIAEAISSVCPKTVFPKKQFVKFEWGTLQIFTEWRDGGYGAVFSYQ